MAISMSFLLGAGFSAPFQIPAMKPFLNSFKTVARAKYPDLYETLLAHLTRLTAEGDLEALLSSLSKAERLDEATPPESNPSAELEQWQSQSRYLKSHLISYIIERCEQFSRDAAFEVVSPFLSRLSDSGSVEIVHLFTTNYDRVLEHVCETSKIEYSDGFARGGTELVSPWNRVFDTKVRLYKLHGSVSYYVDLEDPLSPGFLRLDRGYPLPGPGFKLSREGRDLEPLMVLPALEKDALGDPYGYLNHLFTDTIAQTKLVIAVGTSLRDNHLVSAIKYGGEDIVALIVDLESSKVRSRLHGVRCVQLRVDGKLFFENSVGRLLDLAEQLDGNVPSDEIFESVERFASAERRLLAQSILSKAQTSALALLMSGTGGVETLGALRELRGVSEEEVVVAVAALLTGEHSNEIRKAAASCLGLSGSPMAVDWLCSAARSDECSDVRLESYLALESIGGDTARDALNEAKERWAGDSYFKTLSTVDGERADP